MIYSEPILQPVDWKKEADMMRIGTNKRLTKKQALSFLKLAGIDPKTGMVIAKSAR
jgi:predicted aconitase with swiveling domain